MTRKYELTEQEAQLAFNQVQSHVAALKNWIVTAVRENDLPHANRLIEELDQYQELYAKLNVQAHKAIDGASK